MIKKGFRLLCATATLTACNTQTIDAHTYDQNITNTIAHIDLTYEAYNQTKQNENSENIAQITQAHQETLKNIHQYHKQLTDYGTYQNDNTYLTAAITYTNNTITLLQSQEKQLIDLYTEITNYQDKDWTPAIERTYKEKQQTIIDTINTQIISDNQAFQQAQAAFAQQQGLTLTGRIQDPS